MNKLQKENGWKNVDMKHIGQKENDGIWWVVMFALSMFVMALPWIIEREYALANQFAPVTETRTVQL